MDKKHVKDIITYLELLQNMFDMTIKDPKANALHRMGIKKQQKKVDKLLKVCESELEEL